MKHTLLIVGKVFLVVLIITILIVEASCDGIFKGSSGAPVVPVAPVAAINTSIPIAPSYATSDQLTALTKTVNDLATQMVQFKSISTTLQSQFTALQLAASTPKTNTELVDLTASVKALQADIDSLKQSIATRSIVLGVAPVDINGLSTAILIKSQSVYSASGAAVPSYGQLSVKISNGSVHTLTNVDIVGTISFSGDLSSIVNGYPTIADGAGAYSYVSSFNGDSKLTFEVYSNGTTNVSIPANGSIILRPKIGILAVAAADNITTTVTVSLANISYDSGR